MPEEKERHYQQSVDADEYSWLLMDSYSEEKSLSSCVSYLLDPNRRPYRYLIALLVSMIEAIVHFSVDFTAGLQATVIKVMELDNTQYDLIFSAYSWPDIVLSILGTVIIDKYLGMRRGLCIFSCILLAGQTIICVGAYTNSFQILLCGRIVLGCSFGTLISLTASFLIVWFKGKEVVFVMSLGRRLGATFALVIPQFLYDSLTDLIVSPYYRHGTTVMFATLLCLCAVLFAVSAAYLDKRSANIVGEKTLAKKNISVLSIVSFSTEFWILVLILSIYFGVVMSFTANAPLFFISKYGFSKKAAGIADSLSYLAVVFATPLFAIVIERVGYNLIWGLIGISFAIIANVVFIATAASNTFAPYIAAVLYSFSFNFFGSAMFVTPGYIVPVHQLTTAYGMFSSLFACTVALANVFSGVVVDHFGYLMLVFFFVAVFIVIGLLSVLLSVMEVASGNVLLNKPGKARMK